MATPQNPRPRRSPLARYAPALAAVVVIAIIAVVIGLAGGSKKAKNEVTPNTTKSGVFTDVPIFYNEAKQQGTLAKYTWQPHCDTTTGDVAIPILNPPPCVPAPAGSNGGKTSTGQWEGLGAKLRDLAETAIGFFSKTRWERSFRVIH